MQNDLSMHLSISQLSELTGRDRRTVAEQLSDVPHTIHLHFDTTSESVRFPSQAAQQNGRGFSIATMNNLFTSNNSLDLLFNPMRLAGADGRTVARRKSIWPAVSTLYAALDALTENRPAKTML